MTKKFPYLYSTMELRTTEAEVQSLLEFYTDNCLRDRLIQYSMTNAADGTPSELWHLLHAFQTKLLSLQPRMDTFRLRAQQVDPITKQSRYGPQTLQRVQSMLQQYDALYKDEYESLILQQTRDEPNLFTRLKEAAESERLQKEKEIEKILREEEQQRLQKEREEEEQQRLQQQASVETRSTALDLPVRDAQDAAEELRRQQDREWIQSIPHRKTLRGVEEQLRRWLAVLPEPQRPTSIRALHTLFQQIIKHPEEANFRRIRRDHVQFQKDIGQYPGGSELLIAAGFQLGTIDRVPCYLSIEPNVEVDFDAWSQWFDLLKGTLDLIEQEMSAVRGK